MYLCAGSYCFVALASRAIERTAHHCNLVASASIIVLLVHAHKSPWPLVWAGSGSCDTEHCIETVTHETDQC